MLDVLGPLRGLRDRERAFRERQRARVEESRRRPLADLDFVAPRIMQRTVSVPGAVTIVAALIGGTLLGMLGALLAIPAAAGLLLLYDEVLVPRQRRV